MKTYTITVYFQDANIEPVSFESPLKHIEIQDICKNGFFNAGAFYPPNEIKKITYREAHRR